jgi:DNA processing protein
VDYYHWFALRSVPGVGNILYKRLIQQFGTPEKALQQPSDALCRVPGISPALAEAIRRHARSAFADVESDRFSRSHARLVTLNCPDYPHLLREISDPPPYLYLYGTLNPEECCVAIVGSRRSSTYGRHVTERLARELAERGVTVVSGLARGIDTSAHQGALDGGGRTIGVLGCGIDILYPPENRELTARMAQRGAVLTEFPFGTAPLAENFPRRNRIVSGLVSGVLVVEASESSGSLITARLALDQGRDVFAIPGNINSSVSRGTNLLIREGAKLVMGIDDILEELPAWKGTPVKAPQAAPQVSPAEEKVWRTLGETPLHIDEITVKSSLTVGEVSAILLRLELRGLVTQLPGKIFSASPC